MIEDPVSDVLRLVSARSVVSGGLMAGGAWAISVPPSDKINFWGLARGACWLAMDGAEPLRIEAGDFLLRTTPCAVLLASDLNADAVDLRAILAGKAGGISRHGDGDDFFMMGGKVDIDAASGRLLLDALPSLIHIRADSPHAATLQWLLGQLVRECSAELPGGSAASSQLAHLMFIQILRAHLDTAALPAGWLRAAHDQRLAPALRLMHGEPGRAWRLEELAQAAHMSRATFALHFKNAAGSAPLNYLTAWRMQLARRTLRLLNTPVAVLAHTLGYASESAFSNAFKRATGRSPKRYRLDHAGTTAADPASAFATPAPALA